MSDATSQQHESPNCRPADWECLLPRSIHRVEADGVQVFYRAAGEINAPVVLLLHGFPTSSFMFRELIPRLAIIIVLSHQICQVSDSPTCRRNENIRTPLIDWRSTIDAFTQALKLDGYAMYVFDYGAPTGFRLAMMHPERVTAIVSQNGNAYEEGLGDAWGPIQKYWAAPSAGKPGHTPPEHSDGRWNPLAVHRRRSQSRECSRLSPTRWTRLCSSARATKKFSSTCFSTTPSNVKLYPKFQEYFRKSKPPLLAIWGKNDPFFIPAGAEAFKKDLPHAKVQFLDTGHFALETHVVEIAAAMKDFLAAGKSAPRSERVTDGFNMS